MSDRHDAELPGAPGLTRGAIAGIAAGVFAVLALLSGIWAVRSDEIPDWPPPSDATFSGPHEGLIYGRVTTDDDRVYEGPLRWGGDEEVLWAQYFNGRRAENRWVAYVPRADLPQERLSIDLFGREIGGWDSHLRLDRPFVVRFGDIVRIDPRGRALFVTLKSGTVVELDRYESDDLADGVRVWDAGGVVDLHEWRIRSIELFAPPAAVGPADALHGTVHTTRGPFTGLVEWNRHQAIGSDALHGFSADGERRVPFASIRSIERRSPEGVRVELDDGGSVVLSGTQETGRAHRGVYVDDPRYGRVLISWELFQRVDFHAGAAAPAYDDHRPGEHLTGAVITRDGRRLAGRLVYDLDESETNETLDAPFDGIDYMIPFSRIASIELPSPGSGRPHAVVRLRGGEELRLQPSGDLGELSAGVLVFGEGAVRPEYVPWQEVARIDLDGSVPPA